MATGPDGRDPGWRKAARRFLPFVVLPVAARTRMASEPPIVMLRTTFLAVVGGLAGFLAVLVALFPVATTKPENLLVYALVAVGPFMLAAIPLARRRVSTLCEPPAKLAEAYVTSVFVSIAFVESAALVAFVATFLAESVWPYLVGIFVSTIGLVAIAPTATRVRSLDEALSQRGCPHSLSDGLYAASCAAADQDGS